MLKKYFENLPYKKNYVIAAFTIWNLLFIPAIIKLFENYLNPDFGLETLPPLGFVFIVCIIVIISKDFQKQILKEGKTFVDIRKDVFLILTISTLLLFSKGRYVFNYS